MWAAQARHFFSLEGDGRGAETEQNRAKSGRAKKKMKGANKSRGAMIFLLFAFGNTEYFSQIVFKFPRSEKLFGNRALTNRDVQGQAPSNVVKSFSLGDFPDKKEPKDKYRKRHF